MLAVVAKTVPPVIVARAQSPSTSGMKRNTFLVVSILRITFIFFPFAITRAFQGRLPPELPYGHDASNPLRKDLETGSRMSSNSCRFALE